MSGFPVARAELRTKITNICLFRILKCEPELFYLWLISWSIVWFGIVCVDKRCNLSGVNFGLVGIFMEHKTASRFINNENNKYLSHGTYYFYLTCFLVRNNRLAVLTSQLNERRAPLFRPNSGQPAGPRQGKQAKHNHLFCFFTLGQFSSYRCLRRWCCFLMKSSISLFFSVFFVVFCFSKWKSGCCDRTFAISKCLTEMRTSSLLTLYCIDNRLFSLSKCMVWL